MTLEVRKPATNKAGSSKITVIELKAQRTLSQSQVKNTKPNDTDWSPENEEDIYVYYPNNKYTVIEIPNAGLYQYQYCIVRDTASFDPSKVTWTTIKTDNAVKISATKAYDGATVYIRQQEIKAKAATLTSAAVEFQMASTYVTHKIDYSGLPTVEANKFTYTRYYSMPLSFNVVLNKPGEVPHETEIESISLGAEPIEFTAETSTTDDVKKLKVTLDKISLDNLPNCSKKPLTIIFKKGAMDSTSIVLTVTEPIKAGSLSVTISKGTDPGTTTFTISTAKGTGNTRYYVKHPMPIFNVLFKEDKFAVISAAYNSAPVLMEKNTATIEANPGECLTILEVDQNGNIVKYKFIDITVGMIK